jgi:hypothetical protein
MKRQREDSESPPPTYNKVALPQEFSYGVARAKYLSSNNGIHRQQKIIFDATNKKFLTNTDNNYILALDKDHIMITQANETQIWNIRRHILVYQSKESVCPVVHYEYLFVYTDKTVTIYNWRKDEIVLTLNDVNYPTAYDRFLITYVDRGLYMLVYDILDNGKLLATLQLDECYRFAPGDIFIPLREGHFLIKGTSKHAHSLIILKGLSEEVLRVMEWHSVISSATELEDDLLVVVRNLRGAVLVRASEAVITIANWKTGETVRNIEMEECDIIGVFPNHDELAFIKNHRKRLQFFKVDMTSSVWTINWRTGEREHKIGEFENDGYHVANMGDTFACVTKTGQIELHLVLQREYTIWKGLIAKLEKRYCIDVVIHT